MVSLYAFKKNKTTKLFYLHFVVSLLFPFVDSFFDVAPIFSSFAIILLRKRELVTFMMFLLSFGCL